MKLKTFLSSIAVILYGVLAGASIDGQQIGIISIFIVFFVVCIIISTLKEENEREKKRKEKREKREQEKLEKIERYNQWLEKYISENGTPDKTITIKENDSNEVIHVHETKKSVYIQGKMYSFSDIMSCTLADSPKTIKGKIVATTKSKNSSTIGRAIVGDLIAGPAGAIIGGTTGKKNTVYHQGEDTVIHNYMVVINLNSIANPILRINTGWNGMLTNEIIGLMNVIIARK